MRCQTLQDRIQRLGVEVGQPKLQCTNARQIAVVSAFRHQEKVDSSEAWLSTSHPLRSWSNTSKEKVMKMLPTASTTLPKDKNRSNPEQSHSSRPQSIALPKNKTKSTLPQHKTCYVHEHKVFPNDRNSSLSQVQELPCLGAQSICR